MRKKGKKSAKWPPPCSGAHYAADWYGEDASPGELRRLRKTIAGAKDVKSVDLGGVPLQYEGARAVADGLAECAAGRPKQGGPLVIEVLCLSGCSMGDSAFEALAPLFALAAQRPPSVVLRQVDVSGNRISDDSLFRLAQSMALQNCLSSCSLFDFSFNDISSGEALAAFLQHVGIRGVSVIGNPVAANWTGAPLPHGAPLALEYVEVTQLEEGLESIAEACASLQWVNGRCAVGGAAAVGDVPPDAAAGWERTHAALRGLRDIIRTFEQPEIGDDVSPRGDGDGQGAHTAPPTETDSYTSRPPSSAGSDEPPHSIRNGSTNSNININGERPSSRACSNSSLDAYTTEYDDFPDQPPPQRCPSRCSSSQKLRATPPGAPAAGGEPPCDGQGPGSKKDKKKKKKKTNNKEKQRQTRAEARREEEPRGTAPSAAAGGARPSQPAADGCAAPRRSVPSGGDPQPAPPADADQQRRPQPGEGRRAPTDRSSTAGESGLRFPLADDDSRYIGESPKPMPSAGNECPSPVSSAGGAACQTQAAASLETDSSLRPKIAEGASEGAAPNGDGNASVRHATSGLGREGSGDEAVHTDRDANLQNTSRISAEELDKADAVLPPEREAHASPVHTPGDKAPPENLAATTTATTTRVAESQEHTDEDSSLRQAGSSRIPSERLDDADPVSPPKREAQVHTREVRASPENAAATTTTTRAVERQARTDEDSNLRQAGSSRILAQEPDDADAVPPPEREAHASPVHTREGRASPENAAATTTTRVVERQAHTDEDSNLRQAGSSRILAEEPDDADAVPPPEREAHASPVRTHEDKTLPENDFAATTTTTRVAERQAHTDEDSNLRQVGSGRILAEEPDDANAVPPPKREAHASPVHTREGRATSAGPRTEVGYRENDEGSQLEFEGHRQEPSLQSKLEVSATSDTVSAALIAPCGDREEKVERKSESNNGTTGRNEMTDFATDHPAGKSEGDSQFAADVSCSPAELPSCEPRAGDTSAAGCWSEAGAGGPPPVAPASGETAAPAGCRHDPDSDGESTFSTASECVKNASGRPSLAGNNNPVPRPSSNLDSGTAPSEEEGRAVDARAADGFDRRGNDNRECDAAGRQCTEPAELSPGHQKPARGDAGAGVCTAAGNSQLQRSKSSGNNTPVSRPPSNPVSGTAPSEEEGRAVDARAAGGGVPDVIHYLFHNLHNVIHNLHNVIHNLHNVIHNLQTVIHNLHNVIHNLHNVIHNLHNVIHNLQNVIHNLHNVIHNLHNVIHNLHNVTRAPVQPMPDSTATHAQRKRGDNDVAGDYNNSDGGRPGAASDELRWERKSKPNGRAATAAAECDSVVDELRWERKSNSNSQAAATAAECDSVVDELRSERKSNPNSRAAAAAAESDSVVDEFKACMALPRERVLRPAQRGALGARGAAPRARDERGRTTPSFAAAGGGPHARSAHPARPHSCQHHPVPPSSRPLSTPLAAARARPHSAKSVTAESYFYRTSAGGAGKQGGSAGCFMRQTVRDMRDRKEHSHEEVVRLLTMAEEHALLERLYYNHQFAERKENRAQKLKGPQDTWASVPNLLEKHHLRTAQRMIQQNRTQCEVMIHLVDVFSSEFGESAKDAYIKAEGLYNRLLLLSAQRDMRIDNRTPHEPRAPTFTPTGFRHG
ncbi:hypothetical protein DIPPA_08949 [Diplonema papillatum]|nr:hypothetical protein DIPPA_08949 [Diplonema papillatum]